MLSLKLFYMVCLEGVLGLGWVWVVGGWCQGGMVFGIFKKEVGVRVRKGKGEGGRGKRAYRVGLDVRADHAGAQVAGLVRGDEVGCEG